jgi:hypothetical protein
MARAWDAELPPSEKLVLLALADAANDEGRCWPSVSTIERKSGQGERTVRRAIQALIKKGHLTQRQRLGTSPLYDVHPCHCGTPAKSAPLPDWPNTPATVAPKPLGTVNTKKDQPSSRARAKKAAHPLPENWEPKPLTAGTVCAQIVATWVPGRIERELSKFRDHHLKSDARWSDWDAAWRTWIQRAGDFENGRTDTNPIGTALGRVQDALRGRGAFR